MENNKFILKVKNYKNLNPEELDLTNLFTVLETHFRSEDYDLWGSVFLSSTKDYSYFYDFNLTYEEDIEKKVITLYVIEDGLTLNDHYISYYIIPKKQIKNRKYKSVNNSEYLDTKNEFTNLQ